MAWVTEFTSTSPMKQRVEYQTNALAHHSQAERPDRVKVSGRVIHKGWVSDHEGFEVYKSAVINGYRPDSGGSGTDDPEDAKWEAENL